METLDQNAVDLFKLKAEPSSITVVERKNLAEAISYALELGQNKEHHELPLPGRPDGPAGPDNSESAGQKTLAAPGWSPEVFSELKNAAEALGFKVVSEDLRAYPAGLDLAFTAADMAVASTATCVLKCPGEDLRLATMLCETQVLALPKSKVVLEADQVEDFLCGALAEEAMYAAFISGPSRTADIERVLTLGVHGPLEMHVVLLDDDEPSGRN